jgi:CheY-like chemotaxis protein
MRWLDRLDCQTRLPAGLDHRMSRRFEYRPQALTLEVPQGDDASVPYAVAGRNISREGIGLLAGQFIYPESACRISLSSPYGSTQIVGGRVARCRYLVGSGSLYEVGVEFESAIDVSLYVPEARRARVLLVGIDTATEELITGFLGTENTTLRCVAAPDDATTAVAQGDADLVLIDLDQPGLDGLGLTRRLRHDGYVGPVVGLTAQAAPEIHEPCAAAGCTGYITKPILREQLRGLVASLADQPLVSSLAGDPALAPLINRFATGLRDRVGEMSRAVQAGDRDAQERIVRDLRAQAGSYGFESISEEAALVHTLITADVPSRSVHAALQRLIDLCLRARPATSPPEVDMTFTPPPFNQTV